DERKDLRKRNKDFTQEREATIINTYIQKPTTIPVPDLLKRVENINISHKPKLKNVYDKDSTVGQLHEDTAYGFKGFVDEESLTAKFKTGNGKDKKEVIKDVTDYIPMFYNTEDKQAYYDAFKKWFIIERKAKTLDAKTITESRIKQELQNREKEAVLKLRETSQKAFKWFVGGGNFCAEIYQINPQNKIGGVPTKDAGEWKSEIISNYNATVRVHRGEDIFYWKNRYPNAKRIMSLKRNDMVTGTFTREEAFEENFPKGIQAYVRPRFEETTNLTETTVLFRVKKINSNGTIYLTPHNIAKEEADTKSWATSSGSLQKYRAKKVYVSPAGRIQNAK
ncbi:MAG: hypothetical protein J6U64_04425, partial [Alphaproteobacteria bacterium]|nr:hypothetical protein [Alphaproteobacteria bacterium]